MEAVKACNILITGPNQGANRGLGLEMAKQLLEVHCSNICHDQDGPDSEALRELAKKHPSVVTLVQLDVVDQWSIKESAKKVGSLLGKNGLNLLVNNAAMLPHKKNMMTATVEDMQNTFNTNVIGPLFEYLPYLRTAAKAKGRPGMSCNIAAVINISTDSASMSIVPVMKEPFPPFPYSINKVCKNPKTLIGVRNSHLYADEILYYTGKTMPW
uniref:Uncharacterized protein n=1 Tax=Sinocyclocheilus grahami TaxID=75366 RepID=A0A672P3A5_SINGR